MPKTVDTRKHCKVGLRACDNLPHPPPYIFVFRGCGILLHALNPTLQCFLVSTVFGTVSSLHLTSFLHLYILGLLRVYTRLNETKTEARQVNQKSSNFKRRNIGITNIIKNTEIW